MTWRRIELHRERPAQARSLKWCVAVIFWKSDETSISSFGFPRSRRRDWSFITIGVVALLMLDQSSLLDIRSIRRRKSLAHLAAKSPSATIQITAERSSSSTVS